MHSPRLETRTFRAVSLCLLALMIVGLAVRNLPWHLDDYDQAKQAFVSYEMVEGGQWWFQHTPSGKIATKPPLAGWISAGLAVLFGPGGWEFAWRLPPFLFTLALLWLLWRCGREMAGLPGALLAACAFGFNVLTPRLATLVRTDMMLALLIFLGGWIIFERVRRAEPWTNAHRAWLSLTVLGTLLTKGPILFAFILPGLAAFAVIARRRGLANHAWPGWWPWLVPMLAFGAWVGLGVAQSREFYEQVVLKEFLGRFDVSDAPVHRHQPLYFYVTHLLGKWAPWGIVLGLLLATRKARARLRIEPALLWLLCWGFGGLVLMSLIPSKRVDRIFPIIPPLCVAVAVLVEDWCGFEERRRRWRNLGIGGAMALSLGYEAVFVAEGFRHDERALVRFGVAARQLADARGGRFALADMDDEGLLLYTRQLDALKSREATEGWVAGRYDRLVIRENDLEADRSRYEPFNVLLQLPRPADQRGAYLLIERPTAAPAR